MRPAHLWLLSYWLIGSVIGISVLTVSGDRRQARRPCRPVDSAWAVLVELTDAVTKLPVSRVFGEDGGIRYLESDSAGTICFRALTSDTASIHLRRPGYRDDSVMILGRPGQVIRREIGLARVARPCCDLNGTWTIQLVLEKPSQMRPVPKGRQASGAMEFGPRYADDARFQDVDSLVRTVHGRHDVDFKPFFGGPYAPDVSTTVFGGGPDLLHEISGTIPEGDSVGITFIPRMSHGGLSLVGRIHGDTVRGTWIQNAYCCGAEGAFVMTRTGLAAAAGPMKRGVQRSEENDDLIGSRWRPELFVDVEGRFWMARNGLFAADSLGGAWRLVLGSDVDPIEDEELRIGIAMAFAGGRAVLGLNKRFAVPKAPVVYGTSDGGATWSAVPEIRLRQVDALEAIDESMWLMGTRDGQGRASAFFRSTDRGATWKESPLPNGMREVRRLYRVSDSVGYVATSGRDGTAALWQTRDQGTHWSPVPTARDQGLHRVPDYGTRVEEIAQVGDWLVVREHGKVFVRPTVGGTWRPLAGIDRVVSDRSGRWLFVLMETGEAGMMDGSLTLAWKTPQRIDRISDVEKLLVRAGVGYLSMSSGEIYEAHAGKLRLVRPMRRVP